MEAVNPELKIYTENLLVGAPEVPDCSVDVVFTSPPYKKKDGLTVELMEILGKVAERVLKPRGRLFMNFGQLRPEGFGCPYEARDAVQAGGLIPGQTICWVKSLAVPGWRRGSMERVKPLLKYIRHEDLSRKELLAMVAELRAFLEGPGETLSRGHYTPLTLRSPTLNYGHESIFTFFKPPESKLDRLSIGVPFADKSNQKRGTRGKNGDLHCAGDTWFIPYKTTGAKKKKATATMGNAYSFPVELPLRAIKVCGLEPGSVVFDPFFGSGSTAVAARQLGMHCWGIELDPEKVPVIQQRWEEAGHVGEGKE